MKSQLEDNLNPFAELLRVMDTEDLIRLRHRLQKTGRKRMVEILSDEIEERDQLEREQSDANRIPSAQGPTGTDQPLPVL
jgi:hypothetical protein